MRRRTGKRALLVLGLIWLLAALFPGASLAEPPFETFSKDGFNHLIRTQAAYYPDKVLANDIYVMRQDKGKTVREYSPLKRPQDLFIDKKDEIYIADTDNNRVVHLDASGKFIRVIDVPDSKLNKPHGVFVTGDGTIYIADTGNKRIIKLDKNGAFLQEFARPQSNYINDSFQYEPTNMVVDGRGFLYVISNGSYQGVVQLDPKGNFYGFYGANATEVSFMEIIRKTFYTEEQQSRQIRTLPSTIRNIFIDELGFIYTVSSGKSEQVKKLNIRGENQWKSIDFSARIRFVRSETPADPKNELKPQLTDVAVDKNGNLIAIDKTFNNISEYGPNGKLLLSWSGPVTFGKPQLGLSQSPVSVAANSKNELFILDDSQNMIHVLEPTEFGVALNKATELSQEGKYEESELHWQEVLKLNALYSPAYLGLAQAAFHKGAYKEALDLYKLAGSGSGYSDSFWQIRLAWFQGNFSWIANTLFTLAILVLVAGRFRSKLPFLKAGKRSFRWSKQPLVQQLRHAFTILKQPLEGFTDLRYSNKGSYLSAFLLLGAVVAVLLIKEYYTSFAFKPVAAENRNSNFIFVFGMTWITWVICNYLIGTIKYGEARFKDVFVGSAYALFPIVLLGLPLALLSNVMTLSEQSIYGFFESAMYIWCALLFFWQIQALQNYGVGETVANISLTAVAMAIMWVLVSITTGLTSELREFVFTVYQEVSM
ncbi:YIP1 family protein [Paenibacillus sp. MBLB4367]|uniref:YIP1 family protein n=1 Tax=Paenibacillus sp. MBLB4367 TaxID=3384767 RepID=UPI0039084208